MLFKAKYRGGNVVKGKAKGKKTTNFRPEFPGGQRLREPVIGGVVSRNIGVSQLFLALKIESSWRASSPVT